MTRGSGVLEATMVGRVWEALGKFPHGGLLQAFVQCQKTIRLQSVFTNLMCISGEIPHGVCFLKVQSIFSKIEMQIIISFHKRQSKCREKTECLPEQLSQQYCSHVLIQRET